MADWDTIYNNAVNQTLYNTNETRHLIDPQISSGLQQIRQVMIETYTPNKILSQQSFRGICLRQLTSVRSETADGGRSVTLHRVKARIPEIHAFLPLPADNTDYTTLAYYPTFVGHVADYTGGTILPGTEVIVTFGNMTNYAEPRLLGVGEIPKNNVSADSSMAIDPATGINKRYVPPAKKAAKAKEGRVDCELRTEDGSSSTGSDKAKGHPRNPLGLIHNKAADFQDGVDLDIHHTRTNYHYSTDEFRAFLQLLDRPKDFPSLWAYPGSKTKWGVQDISPEWADGILKLRRHGSHREGRDADIGIPKIGIEEARYWSPNEKPTIETIDLNRALIFILIARMAGSKFVILWDGFRNPLWARAQILAAHTSEKSAFTTASPIWDALPPEQQAFFTEYLPTSAQMRKILNWEFGATVKSKGGGTYSPSKRAVEGVLYWDLDYHQDHFHVRMGTRYVTRLRAAAAKLEASKCGQVYKDNPEWVESRPK